ncbi:MAG: hypothetical protein HC895_23840 [Leptolyngbyaceae cyanobacterium SM1_3_5]|nr:hypothetical protein [Leptolyngbyaceae cyanobacterium SM1_3_5]
MSGSSADDTLIAGQGRASIDGGAGNDTLVGGRAADRLVGGDGNGFAHRRR